MNNNDKYLNSLENQINRFENKLDRFDGKFDDITKELSQINKILAMQHASLDEHIAGVNTLKLMYQQLQEECEAETERLEQEIDKDEERISKLEESQKISSEVRKTIFTHIWTTIKFSAILGYIVGGLLALFGKGTSVLNFFKNILGFNN